MDSTFFGWTHSQTNSRQTVNKWSKNFDERPHRRRRAPPKIAPSYEGRAPGPHSYVHGSLGPPDSKFRTASRSVQPFL